MTAHRGVRAATLVCVAIVNAGWCPVTIRPKVDHAVCPVPRSEERADLLAAETDTARAEPAMGVIPDGTSALNRSELRLLADTAAILDAPVDNGATPETTSFLFSQDVLFRLTAKHVTAYVAKGAAQLFLQDGDGKKGWWTTTRLGVGLRHVRGIAGNHIRGMAIRADVSEGNDAGGLLAYRPLDTMRLADGWTAQAIAEVRYELRGCFAPFMHVQFGGRKRSDDWDIAVPVSVSIGAHRDVGDEPIMLWGGYELTSLPRSDAGRAFEQRLRLGAEALSLGSTGIRLGAAFEIVIGPVDGTFATVTLTAPLTFHRP